MKHISKRKAYRTYFLPDLKHARRVRPTMKYHLLPATQHTRELRRDETATVGKILSVDDDVFDILRVARVEDPIDLGLGKEQTDSLCTYVFTS